MLDSFVQIDAYCQDLSNSLIIKFLWRENLIVKKLKQQKSRYFKSSTHVPFAISSLFLSKYFDIISVLTTWRRRWNTWTNVSVIWFHVRQNFQKLLNSFTIFSYIFWKSSCEENILYLYLKFAPVDSRSCMFHVTCFILLKSLCITTSTLSIFLVMFEIYSLSEQDASTHAD